VVILFEPAGASEALRGQGFKDMCGDKAIFVRCELPDEVQAIDRNHIWRESRLKSDNIPGAYNVAAGRTTVVVADWHGNEWFRPAARVTPAQLERMLSDVGSRVDAAEQRMARQLERARNSLTEDNRRDAINTLRRSARDGVVGLDSANETLKLLDEIIAQGRKDVEAASKAGDKAKLEALEAEFEGTEVADEARKARESRN